MIGLTKMSFKPPVLTEEEDTLHGSKFLTDDLQCDGCLAIAYQFHESLQQRQAKRPKSLGLLPQSQLIDITGKLQPTMSFTSNLIRESHINQVYVI